MADAIIIFCYEETRQIKSRQHLLLPAFCLQKKRVSHATLGRCPTLGLKTIGVLTFEPLNSEKK
jgi:hypothetical protein